MPEWVQDTQRFADVTALRIATDIHRVAGMNAPVESGQLIRSGRVARAGLAHYIISFGGASVKYAKRRHYENKKNPGTRLYLQRAGDSISRNFKRYLEAKR